MVGYKCYVERSCEHSNIALVSIRLGSCGVSHSMLAAHIRTYLHILTQFGRCSSFYLLKFEALEM
jgi:hypothetical protein